MKSSIELTNVSHAFNNNGEQITLFKALNLCIKQGESYAITGPSGSGKSSLLLLASGLEACQTGSVGYQNQQNNIAIDALRSDIGFIFQQFHLLPELTALNNVALPLKLRGDKEATNKARAWLGKVGLSERENHKPSQLSGGEQQRVAIARALVFEPKFIFADEPTGNLDQQSAEQVAKMLIACCKENNAGLVMVTHSDSLARCAEHRYTLFNGDLSMQQPNIALENVC